MSAYIPTAAQVICRDHHVSECYDALTSGRRWECTPECKAWWANRRPHRRPPVPQPSEEA